METRNSSLGRLGRSERRGELQPAPKVVLSASFKRHLSEVGQAIDSFNLLGVEVLSPNDNRVVDSLGQFAFLDSDRRRSIKGVQNRHFAAIDNADLLYLICPDGYTGQSVCLELGYAIASQTPIIASHLPCDDTVRQYVDSVLAPRQAAGWMAKQRRQRALGRGLILLRPEETVAALHDLLEVTQAQLTDTSRHSEGDPAEESIRLARRLLDLPGHRLK